MFILHGLTALGGVARSQPGTPFSVRTFGATGNGETLDSPAINQAINAAHEAGGGTVHFPAGTYLSASIHLKSNITLYLEAGATILAADDAVAKYDDPEPNAWTAYQDFGHSHWQNSLIWGIGLEGIAILGPGLIHGKGLSRDHRGSVSEDIAKGSGNKAIALRDCHNVTIRDISVLHGGHFAILATGVDTLTIDNVKLDTNRDGMNIDACRNVRISNCSVNSPWNDGICLKASYALGERRACEHVTISNCFLAGNYEEGTMLDATWRRCKPESQARRTGRIKLGTESNGDFRNIAISNCVFDECRGLAIESVDGAVIEDIVISNITMRRVTNSPLFIRLGNRARGPAGTAAGAIRRICIDNLVAFEGDTDGALGCIIAGIPGHPVEDVRISNVRITHLGGGSKEWAERVPPEEEAAYPEPSMFGPTPAYGFFLRHATGIELHHVKLDHNGDDARAPFVLDDVSDIHLDHVQAKPSSSGIFFDLRNVKGLEVHDCPGISGTSRPGPVAREEL